MVGGSGTNGASGTLVFEQSDLVPSSLLLGAFLALGNQVLLSWPLSVTNYTLESTSSLGPDGSWTPATNPVGIVANSYVATNSVSPGAAYFRLRSGQ
jgi:hypothetical protein